MSSGETADEKEPREPLDARLVASREAESPTAAPGVDDARGTADGQASGSGLTPQTLISGDYGGHVKRVAAPTTEAEGQPDPSGESTQDDGADDVDISPSKSTP